MNTIFNNPSVLVIDNFFKDFHILEKGFRDEPLYDFENHPEKEGRSPLEFWCGKRSRNLFVSNPFIVSLFFHVAEQKIGINQDFDPSIYLHLRPEHTVEEEFCHQDPCGIAALVYLSETNLNSGTNFYEPPSELDLKTKTPSEYPKDLKVLNTVNFVQNRAIFFSSKIWHSAFGAHGNDETDGRLTLNVFMYS